MDYLVQAKILEAAEEHWMFENLQKLYSQSKARSKKIYILKIRLGHARNCKGASLQC